MRENKLIAVDLDGTLFHTNHQISDRTLRTMYEVVKSNHTIVIVTGRSSHSAIPKLQSIPHGIRMICSNGAYEFDRESQTITRSNAIPASITIDLQNRILKQLPSASFGWESASGLGYESKFIEEAGGAHTLEQGGFHDPTASVDTLKIFVRTPEQKRAELARTLQRILGTTVEVSSSGAPFAEITAAGVNKGRALEQVAVDLGFTAEETMAFGDNQNDIPMLSWAGESVAMDNAIPELKAICNAATLSNSEDGVARYLEKKFGLKSN